MSTHPSHELNPSAYQAMMENQNDEKTPARSGIPFKVRGHHGHDDGINRWASSSNPAVEKACSVVDEGCIPLNVYHAVQLLVPELPSPRTISKGRKHLDEKMKKQLTLPSDNVHSCHEEVDDSSAIEIKYHCPQCPAVFQYRGWHARHHLCCDASEHVD